MIGRRIRGCRPWVSVRELAEALTPTAEEVTWACAKVLGPGSRLVMLKCYQRLGYFPQLEWVPWEVVEYVCAQAVGVVEGGVGPLGRQPDRTIRRCRELVREYTGAVWEPQLVRGVAESAMRAALLSKDNPADVINVALEALSGRGCELPGPGPLRPPRCHLQRRRQHGPAHRAGGTTPGVSCRVEILKAVVMCKAGARDVIISQNRDRVTDPTRSPDAAPRPRYRQTDRTDNGLTVHRLSFRCRGTGPDRPPRSPVRRSFVPRNTGTPQTAEQPQHTLMAGSRRIWALPGQGPRYRRRYLCQPFGRVGCVGCMELFADEALSAGRVKAVVDERAGRARDRD